MKTVLFLGIATFLSLTTSDQNKRYTHSSPAVKTSKPVIDGSYMKEQVLKERGFSEFLKLLQT
jgi:hypothetical protein